MVEIQVQLPESVNEYVQAQIAMGRYASASDFVRDLLRADQQQQHLVAQLEENDVLARQLESGMSSGEGRRWTPEVLDELRQQVIDRERVRGDNR